MPDEAHDPIDEARSTLLRALEELDRAREELDGPPARVDLMVIYSLGRREEGGWREIEGYSTTGGPMWVHATMLRRAAEAHEESVRIVDETFNDEDFEDDYDSE